MAANNLRLNLPVVHKKQARNTNEKVSLRLVNKKELKPIQVNEKIPFKHEIKQVEEIAQNKTMIHQEKLIKEEFKI